MAVANRGRWRFSEARNSHFALEVGIGLLLGFWCTVFRLCGRLFTSSIFENGVYLYSRNSAVLFLHCRQQDVLLGLGEAMDFVDEQDSLVAPAQFDSRLVDLGPDLFDASGDRAQFDEA